MTAFAIELTWPGVPVTACASIRPSRSNTPAERSPASRTEVEKAVRIMVCACSSTTAMSRLHMICVWICARAAVGRAIMMAPVLGALRRHLSEHCFRIRGRHDVEIDYDLLVVAAHDDEIKFLAGVQIFFLMRHVRREVDEI